MKKITLILLVALVPYLTMAQKRSKKNKNTVTEKAVEFMVIKGVELLLDKPQNNIDKKSSLLAVAGKLQNSKVIIYYDFGRIESEQNSELIGMSKKIISMVDAVNIAASKGWQFQSANVYFEGDTRTHYYYMTKSK